MWLLPFTGKPPTKKHLNLLLTRVLYTAFYLPSSIPTANLPLIHFFSVLRLLENTWWKNDPTNTHEESRGITYMQLLPADQGETNTWIWIMQLISGNSSRRSQMQTKRCSCLYSSICLGSPAGDRGDDSTHMPSSSGLPDFWYFTNPVEIYSSSCSVFWGRTSAQLAGLICAPLHPLEEADPWCYLESISQITMTRSFSSEEF